MSYENDHDISVLNGRRILDVTGMEEGSYEVHFTCADGSKWRMVHCQDCCELVNVEDVVGDVADLICADVIDARQEVGGDDPAGYQVPEYRDSYTWTFYIIQTNKGAVTIRWLGESNGWYSETVDFECVREAAA